MMRRSPVPFVATVLFVLHAALCHEYSHENAYYKVMRDGRMEMNKFMPNEYGCKTGNFTKSAMGMLMSGACMKPRPTVVPIFTEDPSTEFIPSQVQVNRCQGLCFSKKACVPTEMKMVQVPIRRMSSRGHAECGYVEVEEHVRCKCGCAITKHHCTSLQIYSEKECDCKCTNKEEKKKCIEEGRLWKMDECRCDCQQVLDCSHGLEWVPKFCKCMRVM